MSFNLTTLLSGLYSRAALNNNFTKIQDYLNKRVLISDPEDSSSSVMKTSLDMNSNRILNIPDAVSSNEPVTKRQLDNASYEVTNSSSNVSYKPTAYPDAVLTNVEDKLSRYVDVKDFGAKGDGTTDDSDAFEAAALAAVGAQTMTQGDLDRAVTAEVHVPAGNYHITRVIKTGNKQIRWILSSGAVIPNLGTNVGPLETNATYDTPNYIYGHVAYNNMRVTKRPCGSRDMNTGFSAQISANPQRGAEIAGFSFPTSLAAYQDRDAVGIYADVYADPNEQILINTVDSYTATRVNFLTPLTEIQVSRLRVGIIIDTRHSGLKYSGSVTSWDPSGSWIETAGWYKMGVTTAGQVPPGSNGILINPVTKIWGANFQVKVPSASHAHSAAGLEIGLSNWKQDSIRFGQQADLAYDNSPFYMWGCHITNFNTNTQSYKAQSLLQLDGRSWYGVVTNNAVENGFYHRGGGSALITQNASLNYRGRILNSGRYIMETKTSLVTNVPDENTSNSFYWDGTLKVGTDGQSLSLGREYGVSTPNLDLICSGGNKGHDARIKVTNGDGSTVGGGFLRLEATGSSGRVYLDAPDVLINSTATRFRPANNNVIKLGDASNRWSAVYAGTGSINTSDETLKTPIEGLSDKEKEAFKALKGLLGKFKFLDAVEDKGDKARYHLGLPAQTAIKIFDDILGEGASYKYGWACRDKKVETIVEEKTRTEEVPITKQVGEEPVYNSEGVQVSTEPTYETVYETVTETYEEITEVETDEYVYAVRYEELLAGIMASI